MKKSTQKKCLQKMRSNKAQKFINRKCAKKLRKQKKKNELEKYDKK